MSTEIKEDPTTCCSESPTSQANIELRNKIFGP